MKDIYTKGVLERAAKELKTEGTMLSVEVHETGEKITVDGINYFDSIISVAVISHNTVIAIYDLNTKKLRYCTNISNIVVIKELVDFLNRFHGAEVYKLNKRSQERLLNLESAKEELDPNCDMSDFEIAEMVGVN